MDKRIHHGSDVRDLQGFLERITANKDAVWVHQALRDYAAKAFPRVSRALAKRAKLAAEAKAKAEAAAAAKAAAAAAAKAEAERKKAARKKKPARPAKATKRPARKAAGKPGKTAGKIRKK